LAKSDFIAPLTFPDCQESVEDLLSTPGEPSCEWGNFKNFWTDWNKLAVLSHPSATDRNFQRKRCFLDACYNTKL
jgi:hypothetical protein